jgi:predicted ArsR family transcriptional regulator
LSSAAAPATGPLHIIEHDSPLAPLFPRFPILARLERELFERVLLCPVQRVDESTPDHYRCVFRLGR